VKKLLLFALPAILLISCADETENKAASIPLAGTWHLISGTTITGKDTVVTDYTKDQQMLKIINDSHFAFVRHDLNNGKDSATAAYSAGAGTYTLNGDQYTEHLDFFNERQWEGHSFNFTISIVNDTLIQKGIEEVETLGIDRLIIEKYARVKSH
jgi:hypothetical protein